MRETISIKLFRGLQRGKKRLSKEALKRIAGFVLSQRTEEGSFMDKSGCPDLYYTLFGRILSYTLGISTDKKKSKTYLASIDIDCLDLIHYAAYIRLQMLNSLFSASVNKIRDLQDFNGVPHNDMESPYTQFVWLSLLEDVQSSKLKVQNLWFKERTFDVEPEIFNFRNYHVKGGGFMNTTDGFSATTNATVAALAVKGQLSGYIENEDIRYVRDLQQPSGGFGAAEASPVPDLLSTATSLFMLGCYGIEPKYPARDFIEAHWLDSGGFSATLLEDKSDVEYTFYGLLALGEMNRVQT